MKRVTTILFAAALCGALPLSAQNTASVTVDTSKTYQQIYGFGGCGMNGQWADVYTQEKVNALWGKDGLNYNIMRIRINPTESNWSQYVNPVIWAKANGATIFATPWTPPYRFKVDAEQTYGDSSNHGHINTDSVYSYAKWLERYRQYMADAGADIDIISIQNECDYDPSGYEGCLYDEDEMALMVSAARQEISSECKIMAPECFGWGSQTYNRTLANYSAAVRKNIDIWGNHIYGATDMTYVNYVRNLTGNPMWMTEYIYDVDSVGTWDYACTFVESIDSCMRSGMSAYVYYNMINHFFGDGNGGGDSSKPGRFAYIMGHYAKYATGMTRVKSSFTDSNDTPVNGSAYLSESGDTISLFVLNKSSEEVALTVTLPFACKQVVSIMTNEVRNHYTTDLSSQHTDETTPTVTLAANAFYTFLFIQSEAEEDEDAEVAVLDANKDISDTNPLNPYNFCADPTAIEYDGRLYVYGTNDQQEYDKTGGLTSNSYGYIRSIVMMSTEDLVNWTFHGTIDMDEVCGSWMYASWAPSIVSREEDDGLTHFYMYFSNSGGGVGVVTSTSPVGPWTDPLGKSLISTSTEGLGLCSSPFDPGAVIDSDGTGWLAFGGGNPNSAGTDLMPGNARIVRLGSDMISLDSDIVPIPAPYHFEANELNIMSNKFVYSYCTSWRDRTDWSTYSSTIDEPTSCSICYMVSSSPLDSTSWTYKGEYLSNPGKFGYTYGNNHSHLQKFGSYYYLLYHTQALEASMDINGGYRSIAMNKATVVERSQRISAVTASNSGISQLTAMRVDPYTEQQAEALCTAAGVSAENYGEVGNTRMNIAESGAWIMVKGVQFNSNGAVKFAATLEGEGTLEVRIDDVEAEPSATLEFSTSGNTEVEVECSDTITSAHNVYFVFTKVNGDVYFDSWRFQEDDTDGVTNVLQSDVTELRSEYFLTSGIQLTEKPEAGIYIRKTYYSDGTVEVVKETAQ